MKSYTLIDTAALRWEEMPGIPGFKRRLLRRDDITGASVEMQYSPPGFSQPILERLRAGAVRHFHKTVIERHYFLAGELPNCDWKDLEDQGGKVTVYRRHTFLDRPPLTLHGLLPGHIPATGSEYLVWNTGGGTALWDAVARQETVEVSGEPHENLQDIVFTQPRILQVDRLPMTPHSHISGWKRLGIAPAIAATPEVAVVVVPPDSEVRVRCAATAETTWLFVLAGTMLLTARTPQGEEPLLLYEGSFLDLDFTDDLSVEYGTAPSDRGCMLVTVGLNFTRLP